MHLPPAPSRADSGRSVLDGHPLGAPCAHPLFQIEGSDGRFAFLLVAGSFALNAPVLLHPEQAAVLPLPPLSVLDASDRPVGDLVVEPVVHGGELLRLGVDAVDGHVEVPVLRVAVQPIDRLVLGQAHLIQEHPGRLISLGRRRLLPLLPAHDPVLHRLGAALGQVNQVDHLLHLFLVIEVQEVQGAPVLHLLTSAAGIRAGDVVGQSSHVGSLALGRRDLRSGDLLDDQDAPPSLAARRAMAARKPASTAAVSRL
jgi:hypothetical protein